MISRQRSTRSYLSWRQRKISRWGCRRKRFRPALSSDTLFSFPCVLPVSPHIRTCCLSTTKLIPSHGALVNARIYYRQKIKNANQSGALNASATLSANVYRPLERIFVLISTHLSHLDRVECQKRL